MRSAFHAVLLAGAIGTATMMTTTTAPAAGITFGFNTGNVAFGYNDGYWDYHHRWHHWHNWRDRDMYRRYHAAEFRAWDHERNRYWYRHERDRYWHRHERDSHAAGHEHDRNHHSPH